MQYIAAMYQSMQGIGQSGSRETERSGGLYFRNQGHFLNCSTVTCVVLMAKVRPLTCRCPTSAVPWSGSVEVEPIRNSTGPGNTAKVCPRVFMHQRGDLAAPGLAATSWRICSKLFFLCCLSLTQD